VGRYRGHRTTVQTRDRPWADAYATVLGGPFAMPSTEVLRQSVAALSERYPHSRLSWSLDPTKRYWRSDRTVESIVAERDWDDNVSVGARLDEMACDDSLAPPLTLIRYPSHIGLKMSHGVGDGRLFLTVISAALQTAFTGEVANWPVQSGGKQPLITAACRTFGRHPSLLMAAINDREPNDVVGTTLGTRPWSPSRRYRHAAMTRDQVDEIFAWGQAVRPTGQ
jgi:hypothetical protein